MNDNLLPFIQTVQMDTRGLTDDSTAIRPIPNFLLVPRP